MKVFTMIPRHMTWLAIAGAICLSQAHAEVLELEGTIKSVDPRTRSITIVRKTAKGEKVLDLEVAKNAGDLGSLKEGDAVAFAYNPDVDIISKIEKGMDEKAQRALKELEGVWMATKVDRHGKMMTPKELQDNPRRIIIEGNTLTIEDTRDGKVGKLGGTITIDPDKKTLDVVGQGSGANLQLLAIYEVNGDELKLCYRRNADGKAARPTEFKAVKENPNSSMSYTCRRLKLD